VVIPAFNEATRLPASLRALIAYLEKWGRTFEILVVDDGSTDETAARAQEAGAVVKLLRNERNRGKGFSVRRGMVEASGERRLMTDADLSTPIVELSRLMAKLDEGYDIAVASRALRGAEIEVHQSFLRENAGRLFNLMVRILVLDGLKDTQCGFKLFTARAAEAAFNLARLDGFCFDVEALFIARKQGARIAEIPVRWRNDAATRVSLVPGLRAFSDLLRIRLNDLAGRYA